MNLRVVSTAAILLTACGGEPEIQGQVVDVWGNPVPEATVVLEGTSTRPTTDQHGNFTLPRVEGTVKLKAGRDGYIQGHTDMTVTEGEDLPSPVIRLYPKPEEPGFYVVGKGDYTRLEPQKVYSFSNELTSITGIKAIETQVESDPLKVVFHTELRMDEIMRLSLQLHELEYKKTAEMQGALGSGEVEVNLWASERAIPVEIDPMRSRHDYLITVEEDLEPGWFAFNTQHLLAPKEPTDIGKVPEALRVAFPFELR